MTPPVHYSDRRYRQLVDWLANEHEVLSQALRREPTAEENRTHAHAFVDLVVDDQAKVGAAWLAAATKIVRFVPPVRPRDPWIN
jgi:aromatic ring-cleaving dioxygenase